MIAAKLANVNSDASIHQLGDNFVLIDQIFTQYGQLLVLLGLGMHTAWRSHKAGILGRKVRVVALIAIVLGIIIPAAMYGRAGVLVTVGAGLGLWIMLSSLIDPVRSFRRSEGAPRMTRSMLGMSVAHFGVGMFTLGVAVVSAFSVETDRALRPGESIDVGSYNFAMLELKDVKGPNYDAREAVVEIRQNGKFLGTVRPQKRQYLVQQSPMTEAGILVTWNRDLFVALGDQLGNDVWSVRVQYKPLIRLIWLGALIMALGGGIAASDRRYRVPQEKEVKVSSKEVTA